MFCMGEKERLFSRVHSLGMRWIQFHLFVFKVAKSMRYLSSLTNSGKTKDLNTRGDFPFESKCQELLTKEAAPYCDRANN